MAQHTDSVEITETTLIKFIIDAVWEATDGGQKMKPEQFYFQEELNGEVARMLTTLQATTSQQVEEAVRKGWKGYVVVDPEVENYKYSPVFSDRKGAEIWLKGQEINGLKVVEVDILLTPNHQD